MLPIEIPDDEIPQGWTRVKWAEHQRQYETLPSLLSPNGQETRARWRLTEDERRAIMDGANVELTIWHFGRPLQPHLLIIQGMEQEPIIQAARGASAQEEHDAAANP